MRALADEMANRLWRQQPRSYRNSAAGREWAAFMRNQLGNGGNGAAAWADVFLACGWAPP